MSDCIRSVTASYLFILLHLQRESLFNCMNGFNTPFPISCVTGKECEFDMNKADFISPLYEHLGKRHHNNIYQNVMQDADYLKFSQQEQELCSQYESLNLSDEQRKVIGHWIDAIHAQNEAYTTVVFRMAMQLCFSLLMQLADL